MKIYPQICLIDVDGTLTKETCFTPQECLNATPVEKVIKKVNEWAITHLVIIYTARKDNLIPATLTWLRKNGVEFHAISNHKIPGDIYLDNKAMRPDEI